MIYALDVNKQLGKCSLSESRGDVSHVRRSHCSTKRQPTAATSNNTVSYALTCRREVFYAHVRAKIYGTVVFFAIVDYDVADGPSVSDPLKVLYCTTTMLTGFSIASRKCKVEIKKQA